MMIISFALTDDTELSLKSPRFYKKIDGKDSSDRRKFSATVPSRQSFGIKCRVYASKFTDFVQKLLGFADYRDI